MSPSENHTLLTGFSNMVNIKEKANVFRSYYIWSFRKLLEVVTKYLFSVNHSRITYLHQTKRHWSFEEMVIWSQRSVSGFLVTCYAVPIYSAIWITSLDSASFYKTGIWYSKTAHELYPCKLGISVWGSNR